MAKLRKPGIGKPNVKLPKVKAPTVKGKPLIKVTKKKPAAKKAVAKRRKGKPAENPEARELLLARDRLTERFTIMQADLGGAFYEMAIRDHVKLDVLTKKAAELQRVDIELEEVEEHLRLLQAEVGLACPSCGTEVSAGDAFCSNCGTDLSTKTNGSGKKPAAEKAPKRKAAR